MSTRAIAVANIAALPVRPAHHERRGKAALQLPFDADAPPRAGSDEGGIVGRTIGAFSGGINGALTGAGLAGSAFSTAVGAVGHAPGGFIWSVLVGAILWGGTVIAGAVDGAHAGASLLPV